MLEQLQKPEALITEQPDGHEVDQQGRTSETAWLAGIIDGEGTIGVQKKETKRRKRIYQPQMSIAGTYFPVLDYLRRLLSGLNVAFYVEERKGTNKRSATWQIHVSGYKRTKRLLPLVLPYLKIKRKQGELLTEFHRIRETLPMVVNPGGWNPVTGKANGAKAIPYTQRELMIIDELHLRNTRDPQRLYAKHSLESEDIV